MSSLLDGYEDDTELLGTFTIDGSGNLVELDDEDDDYMIYRGYSSKSDDDDKKSLVKFTQYVMKEGHYMPMQDTIKKLPAGYYKPDKNNYTGEMYVTPKEIVLPTLYDLPNDMHKKIIDDIKRFWESEERYKKFGNVYKRNILLYSVPGNGKTSLINLLAQDLIKNYDGIVITIDDENSLELYPKVMQRIRQIEPERKVITVIEDFERLIKKDYLSALLLQILDGAEQFNNVVTIATTNYPENIGEQYTSRPSRFNIKVEYKKPNAEVRRFYITKKLTDADIEITDTVKEDIERYVKKTKGFTFDFVKEVVQGIYVEGISEEEIFNRLNEAIKKKGVYKTSENKISSVGFSKDDVDD